MTGDEDGCGAFPHEGGGRTGDEDWLVSDKMMLVVDNASELQIYNPG